MRASARLRASRRTRRLTTTIAFGGVAALVTSIGVPALAAPSALVRDGTSSERAAASCWEIKQTTPAAPSGRYWLQTPTLVAPAEFYCDQITDGGGWVLIGRGRETWGLLYNGQGTASQVASVVDGTGAFTPRALSAQTVDGLMNGQSVSSLPGGIRLRRATNTAGSSWQETRFTLPSRSRWVWALDAGHPVGTWSMTSLTIGATGNGSGGTSNSFGSNNAYLRVQTSTGSSSSYRAGFSYGTGVSGSTSTSSYIYKSGSGLAIPFTQVYIRPQLLSGSMAYPAVPDTGTVASELRELPSNYSLAQSWGVSGSGNGSLQLFDTEVHAFTQSGTRMLVGGNFRYVQRGASPAPGDQVEQRFLAAFDATTADWLPDFRPTFNGQVLALETLPSGIIVAGGEFTTVNGLPVPGIVALDPVSGQIAANWQVLLEQRVSGTPLYVRALAVHDGWLYLGGAFSHLSGGTRPTPAYSRNAARVAVGDGTPDFTWRPAFNGQVNSLSPSADGTRLYLAGWFTNVGGVPQNRVSVLSTSAGAAPVAGLQPPRHSAAGNYQQAVREVGDRVWHGGSEHNLFSYNASDFVSLSGNITKGGGDFQVIGDVNGVVIGGCHCQQWVYHDAYAWPTPVGWTQADNIRYIGAWDAATGAYIPEFVPEGLDTSRKHGPWAIESDNADTIWVGGDFSYSRTSTGATQWNGGFFRLPQRDSTAPTTPSSLTQGRTTGGDLKLSWPAATDGSGVPPLYEIIAGDRVIATRAALSVALPLPDAPTRYFVRAIDKAGNRSASTAGVLVTP